MSRAGTRKENRLVVLHLVPSFTGGGAERQLAWLAPELGRLGVDVHVAFLHAGVNFELALVSNATLHRIPCWGNHDPAILFRVLALIRTIRPHVVQTWFRQMDILGGLAAKISGVPFVLSERSSALAYPGTWKNRLREWVGRGAVAIVANSQGGADYWRSRAKSAGLHVIRNGISLDRIRKVAPVEPRLWELPGDAQLIVFAGRLSPEKNLYTLLDALEQVLDRHREAVVLLFGEGPLRLEIEERIKHSRFPRRFYLPGFTHDLWGWMRSARVVVSISRFEGNPNVVLEAMAIGCPLVVSDIPQHREILDDSMAMFCRADSVQDVAAAIDATLSNTAAAEARADAAQGRAQAWSIEETARQYVRLYETLVS